MVLVVPKGTYAGKLTNHRSLGADVIRARSMLVKNLSFKEDNYLIFKVLLDELQICSIPLGETLNALLDRHLTLPKGDIC